MISYIKVIGSRSRSQKQKKRVYVSGLRVICFRVKGNFV